MKKLHITILLGTAREGRLSEHIANFLYTEIASREDVTIELVDVKDHLSGRTIPPWEENDDTKVWKNIVAKTDGFIIVSPEYNHGYPGELKILLDQEHDAYRGKPVIVAAVSAGILGGSRLIEHIQPVLSEIGMIFLPFSLRFDNVQTFLDEKGNVTRKDEYLSRIKKTIDALVLYMKRLEGVATELQTHKK
ncbi:MAG: NADPH-dependent FMN reductase [Candidatus Magasanikbacteria bacterium CG_4_9_14_0_2_um_filter_41_10]|uniref:NADPH-dependent FMN reductase n=1 Tax=Candidatus Magasanikbacteria bacterium CG_4_10_14_0_2_um_filter_41_31 TaxID=1974639 RepID=A0A2M7V4D3_9BACT|nr:MAG: hypothetical protein AUJ37_00915 [Candidatus Magasanikbacteria bacterium CG1_02_41_34]PIZ93407.1 MAG: NADPH-dependent FMN reductase [Candidatus Magasanikbacteria bacterium CG_4_10_14_0_2_um_filter_41_31]PJC53208.1 MAG: NADPH-dependent FMN reductase [Candidatus Magasanikbacteria bacterium CG_4_9_14_0_2_um_filter_41_10]